MDPMGPLEGVCWGLDSIQTLPDTKPHPTFLIPPQSCGYQVGSDWWLWTLG